MHMQVAPQVLRPRMQHQREGADAAQPARVGGELGQCGRAALHQRVVDPARVHCGQRIDLVRQREHQVAVGYVEQLGQPRRAPRITLLCLALRAVPVAARVPAPLLGATAGRHCWAPQPSQRSRWPPSAGVRQATIARQARA
jgi:hypothetical protein